MNQQNYERGDFSIMKMLNKMAIVKRNKTKSQHLKQETAPSASCDHYHFPHEKEEKC